MVLGTEDNNKEKKISRQHIAALINYHFKHMDNINMFDFLGAGIGAEYYVDNVKGLLSMTLLDSKKCKVKNFLLNKYRKLCDKNVLINVFNMDINPYLEKVCNSPFDVFCLDFCTYFYDNNKENCSKYIIENVFKNKTIVKDGLLICTFQIAGYGINMRRTKDNIITCKNTILEEIKNLAEEYGYCVDGDSYIHEYKSSKTSKMVNIALKFNG